MKILFSVIILCLVFQVTSAQEKEGDKPLTIHGRLENMQGQQLFISFKNGSRYVVDTIFMKADGQFFLKTFAVKKPVRAQLFYQNVLLTDLNLAPGYDLELTGDIKNFTASKKISGAGALSNAYLFSCDVALSRNSMLSYRAEMTTAEVLKYIKNVSQLKDSLFNKFFSNAEPADPWLSHFSTMALLDNEFWKLLILTYHVVDNNNLNYNESVSLVSDNFNKALLADLYKKEFIISEEYKILMTDYQFYLATLACRRDSTACYDSKTVNQRLLEIIASNYTGEIKQLKLFQRMQGALRYCRSFEELNRYKDVFPKYMSLLEINSEKAEIEGLFANMEKVLLQTQVGYPAPLFTVIDSTGKKYRAADDIGKVIYIDLWASWCGPCRMETPHLQKLYNKYQNEKRLKIISIALSDTDKAWKAALIKDHPTWLQFFDHNGDVQRSYVANSIPKFILIDKKGNIVNFDSPLPSAGAELEKLLNEEIAK